MKFCPAKETATFSRTAHAHVSAKTARTHVEIRLVWPVLAPDWHELFAVRELRVEQHLGRAIEYMRHFARRGIQAA